MIEALRKFVSSRSPSISLPALGLMIAAYVVVKVGFILLILAAL